MGAMREWSIPHDGPYTLRLAADVRSGPTDYVNDQIWELVLGYSDPPSMALRTSYGLRARDMRIFPGFRWDGSSVTDPSKFASPPIVRLVLPNYAIIECFPFEGLFARGEYWVRDSHAVLGRWTLQNQRADAGEAYLRIYAWLHADEDSEPVSASTQQGVVVLSGKAGDLAPVLFLEGGARSPAAPYPALEVRQRLDPAESRSWTWAHAGENVFQSSFEQARHLAALKWNSGTAGLNVAAGGMLDIETGDPDWDAAFWMAQKAAISAYIGPAKRLPHASFVEMRGPENGYSPKGSGADYQDRWNGQDAFWAYPNFSACLYAAPELPKGIIQNFLHTQNADGEIDRRPGLAGQRSGLLCPPLLATLSLGIYQRTEDRDFLESVFPKLVEFADSWGLPSHDLDSDGHPEWDHTIHAGFDDWPTFMRWKRWGQGYDISKAETNDLASYLLRDCTSLIAIAEILDERKRIPELEKKIRRLKESVEGSWDEARGMYLHQDRDNHSSSTGELLGSGRGPFVLDVEREFEQPLRICVRCVGPEDQSRTIKVSIHSLGPRGGKKVERITANKFQWFWTFGTATSETLSNAIERIEVKGVSDKFETEIWIPDLTRYDASGLLPLWAGIPDPERAARLIDSVIKNNAGFWREYGIPACPASDPAYGPGTDHGTGEVYPHWNSMIGEGLLAYGRVDEAVELVTKLVRATVHALKSDHGHRRTYHPDLPEGFGERDHIQGGAPIGLFLATLGIRLISPTKVEVWGRNPYPWPVRIRWMGLEILSERKRRHIQFPDGQSVEISNEARQLLEQLSERAERS
jgi:hypothetical protein